MNEPKKKFWTPLRVGLAVFLFALSICVLQLVAHLNSSMTNAPIRGRGMGNIVEHTPNPYRVKVREPSANITIESKKGKKICGFVGCTINASCVIKNSGDKDAIVEVTLNIHDQGSKISETKKVIAEKRTFQSVDFKINRSVSDKAGFNCEYEEK